MAESMRQRDDPAASLEPPRAPIDLKPQSLDDAVDIYVPGCWICVKCGFALSQQTMFMASGTIGVTKEQILAVDGELCPNDGEPMRRETWHERAESNYKWGLDLMERLITATGAEHLPGAFEKIESLRAEVERWRAQADTHKASPAASQD